MACQRLEHCREHVHYSLAGRNRGFQRRISLWLESLHLHFWAGGLDPQEQLLALCACLVWRRPCCKRWHQRQRRGDAIRWRCGLRKTQAGFPRGPVRLDGAPFFGHYRQEQCAREYWNSVPVLVRRQSAKKGGLTGAAFSFGCGDGDSNPNGLRRQNDNPLYRLIPAPAGQNTLRTKVCQLASVVSECVSTQRRKFHFQTPMSAAISAAA